VAQLQRAATSSVAPVVPALLDDHHAFGTTLSSRFYWPGRGHQRVVAAFVRQTELRAVFRCEPHTGRGKPAGRSRLTRWRLGRATRQISTSTTHPPRMMCAGLRSQLVLADSGLTQDRCS
jgi:hypothetical protein